MAAKKTKTTRKKKPAAKAAKKGSARAADVNMGHIFALRPRVDVSFAPERLRRAKDELAEETYASLPDAARAVAEKALEDSRKPRPGRRGKR